jgi:hypothetical protein
MKRIRHQHRVEGVNRRAEQRMAGKPVTARQRRDEGREHGAEADLAPIDFDRLRYGDCAGFGAPEAQAMERRRQRAGEPADIAA